MPSSNIYDVAKRAGVGIGTVSRVINKSSQVSEDTRRRVLQAIKELNYKPSNVARRLSRNQRLHNIGVVTLSFSSYYSFAERLRGVQFILNEVADPSYDLVLYTTHSLDHYSERLAAIVNERSVEGLLIVDLDISESYKQALREIGLPFVGINHWLDADWPCITTDNVQGGMLATQHLIDLGHRRIAYIGDNFLDQFGFPTSEERHEGYRRALANAGIVYREDYVSLGPHGYDSARHLIPSLLSLPEPPTAIFAMSDIQAIGCLSALREAGVRVPEDVSLIGYDDLEISAHIGLSTVQQHLGLSGSAAMLRLLNLMAGVVEEPPSLPPLKVIPRQTTATRQ